MKLFILLLLASCGTMHNEFNPTRYYLVTKQLVCPSSYALVKDINNRYYCILTDINTNTKTNTIKPLKTAKKPLKIDCQRVFRDINSCMKQ